MKSTTIAGVAVAVFVAGGVWWYVAQQPQPSPSVSDTSATPTKTQESTDTSQTQVQVQVNTTPTSATVTYRDDGFSPATVTIAKGDTVTFANQSGGQMWVASGPHPAHTNYSDTTREQHCPDTADTSFDQCTAVAAGQSYSFTFQKTGTWKYHNHVGAGDFGTIVVQ